MTAATTVSRLARRTGALADRILAEPRAVFGTLVVVQIAATVALGLAATHNGWVWFQGGDQIWFVSDAWSFGDLKLPPGDVGPGWSIPLIPAAMILGSTFVEAMPLIVALNVLVLGPLALGCVWSLAGRIGGRALSVWASVLWIVAPFAAIPLFVDRYHERWVDQFLPQALGLTGMADFPSMVALLVVAALVARSLETRVWTDVALAGLVLGFAGLMKPPNYLIVPGIVLAYAIVRRWRDAVVLGLAIAPSLVALTIYKQRGLGFLPLFALDEAKLAVGAFLGIDLDTDRYIDLDLERWRVQMAQLREYLWSARLVQFAPFAGLLAVARLRLPLAALLGGWLAAFVVIKGNAPQASIEANTMWRLLMPAWPAYLILVAAIPALVPTLARRLGSRLAPPAIGPVGKRGLRAGVVALAVLPLLLFALLPRRGDDALVLTNTGGTLLLIPTRAELAGTGTREPDGSVRLTWKAPDWGPKLSYQIFQADFSGSEVLCPEPRDWSIRCSLEADLVGETTDTTWVDPNPTPESAYRIGAAVRYDGAVEGADVFALSPSIVPPPAS